MFKTKIKGGNGGGKKAADSIMSAIPSKARVVAGLPANSAPYPDGTNIILVGMTNEFGCEAKNIPARSFLGWTLRNHVEEYSKAGLKVGKAISLRKVAWKVGLGQLGTMMQDDIKQRIVDIKDPPNAAMTIAIKGVDNPLVDTGHLGQSIRYEVREGRDD